MLRCSGEAAEAVRGGSEGAEGPRRGKKRAWEAPDSEARPRGNGGAAGRQWISKESRNPQSRRGLQ